MPLPKAVPTEALDFPYRDQFPTPLHVVSLYDESVRTGVVTLSDWQKEVLLELGRTRGQITDKIKVMLLAANGSGKSKYILAPFAVWMALVFKESLTVITTASGDQLDTQAQRYIARLCQSVNSMHYDDLGFNVFECKYREFRANITKSFIDLFATDEPSKAEGRHPLVPSGEFAIIVDEAKSVSDDIYQALERCKGCTRRIEISSAEDCKGYFYNTWCNTDYRCYRRKVTAFDCPHITQEEIEETIIKYGQDSPFVRGSIYSEFVSLEEEAIISRQLLLRSSKMASCATQFGPLVAGLDLASGGDETVLSVWHGNVELGMHTMRNQDTTKTVNSIIEILHDIYKGRLLAENIWADDGGIGRSMIDNFNEKGYKLKRVLNQARPFDVTRYANRGTELWFTFKRFIEEYQVHFLLDSLGNMDKTLFSQLTNRYVKKADNNTTLKLESKLEARKNKHASPDRADAVVLAWCGRIYPLPEINGTTDKVSRPKQGLAIDDLKESLRREKMHLNKPSTGRPLIYTDTQTATMSKGRVFTHNNIFKHNPAAKYLRRN